MRRQCACDAPQIQIGIDWISMEAAPLPIPNGEESGQVASALRAQRQKVREFLSAQQQRLQRAEGELAAQLDRIAEEMAADRQQSLQTREELARRSSEIERQAETMQQLKAELAVRQAEWEKLYRGVIEQQQALAEQSKLQQSEFARRQQELLAQQAAVAAASTETLRKTREAEVANAEAQIRRVELDARRQSLDSRELQLEKQNQELIARTAETESLRRRIAGELKVRRAANLKEIELRRQGAEQAAKADHAELLGQITSLQQECRDLREKAASAPSGADEDEIERIEAEKQDLSNRLTELQVQLGEARQQLADARATRHEAADDDDLNRRYEMAIEDLRELKTRNEDLQEQLTRASQAGTAGAAQAQSGVLNWEAEKQRILAALEADFDEAKEEEREEKLKIHELVHKTDRVLEEKNREIGELRNLLESQTHNIGSMAVGAAALGEILDSDALIQEERNNLARLQDECRDKLRQAEVQLSLERAKIARERSQLNDKIHILEQQGINLAAVADEKEAEKQPKGRWRARLGLTGPDDAAK
jgi:hypothetical protein